MPLRSLSGIRHLARRWTGRRSRRRSLRRSGGRSRRRQLRRGRTRAAWRYRCHGIAATRRGLSRSCRFRRESAVHGASGCSSRTSPGQHYQHQDAGNQRQDDRQADHEEGYVLFVGPVLTLRDGRLGPLDVLLNVGVARREAVDLLELGQRVVIPLLVEEADRLVVLLADDTLTRLGAGLADELAGNRDRQREVEALDLLS